MTQDLTREFLDVVKQAKEPIEVPKGLKYRERKELLTDLIDEADDLRHEMKNMGVPLDYDEFPIYRYASGVWLERLFNACIWTAGITFLVGLILLALDIFSTKEEAYGPMLIIATLLFCALTRLLFARKEKTIYVGLSLRTIVEFAWPSRASLEEVARMLQRHERQLRDQKALEKMKQPYLERFRALKPIARELRGTMKVGHVTTQWIERRLCVDFEIPIRCPESEELCSRYFMPERSDYNRAVVLLGKILDYARDEPAEVEWREAEFREILQYIEANKTSNGGIIQTNLIQTECDV